MRGLTIDELLAWTPPYQPYIIDKNILVPDTRMVIYGKNYTWKSMLSLHIGCTIADGKQFFGINTKPNPVYILQAEIPQMMEKDRVKSYTVGTPVSKKNIWVASEPYTKLDKGFGLAELEKEASRTRFKVLIIDPLYKFMSGRLTDEWDVRQFLDRIDLMIAKHHFAIIIIHHDRKSQIFEGMALRQGSEDIFGSFLENWADTIVRTSTTSTYGEIILDFEKVRHAHEEVKSITIQATQDKAKDSITFVRKR